MRLTVGSLASGILGCAVLCMMPETAAQNARLYVDNSAGDNITVIDLKSMKPVDDIKLGQKVHGLAVQGDGRRLFATVESDNTVREIDTRTDKIMATIKLTGRPNQCAVTPDGRYVVVPIRDRDAADIIDVAQKKVVKTLPIPKPHNAYNASSNRFMFVSSMGEDEIEIIDLTKMDYSAHVPVGGVPRPYVVTPDGGTMYVALSNLHGFVKVDVSNKRILQRVVIPAEHPTPHNRRFESMDTLTHGLALSPDGTALWVTSLLDNSLYIYDIPGDKIVGHVQVGDGPNWVVFSPDGRYVSVSNTDSDDVSIIDAKARREVARVKVGKAPKRIVAAAVPGAND
jgi:YVTN family beta-propeller protein